MVKNIFRVLWVRRRYPQAYIPLTVSFHINDFSALKMENRVVLSSFSEIVVISVDSSLGISGELSVGSETYIGAFSNLRAVGGRISIGNHVQIAQHVSIIAANHVIEPVVGTRTSLDRRRNGVTIGDGVWIGANSVILPGVEIGDQAVVGAGAVVTRSIPPRQIWAGNPARLVRPI